MFYYSKSDKSIGHGLVYESEKTENLMTGSNQVWYTFKGFLIDHITCNSIHSSGQDHLKAKQYAVKKEEKDYTQY